MEGEAAEADAFSSSEDENTPPIMEMLVMDMAEEDEAEDDEETLLAVEVAEQFTTLYDDHVVLECTLRDELKAQAEADEVEGLPEPDADDGAVAQQQDDDEENEGALIDGAAEAAFERLLVAASTSAQDEDTLMAFVDADEVAEAEDVTDMQGPRGFRKYDEEEHSGISEEDRAAMADIKLTKAELANLVPEDWDSINVDWFSNKKEDNIPLPEYKLNFIWTERNIAVAVDQVYSRGQVSPLTEYFFWPRKDAWDELRMALEARPWIPERDKVILLNRTTEVINTWQVEGENRPSLDVVKAEFPDCSFMGTSTPPPPPPPPAYNPEPMAMSA